MRTEMPTDTCPKDAAENDKRRMLNSSQRTMDRFIRWTFLEFVPKAEHRICERCLIVPQKSANALVTFLLY